MAKGLGWCAFLGTFFSIIDTIRNPRFHNFTSVCIFGCVCWVLLKTATLIKRPSFANDVPVQTADTVVGRRFGTPQWVRPSIWISLFIVMIGLLGGLFRHRYSLQLRGGALQIAAFAIFALYLIACQQAERLARACLRRRYPDQPQVAIGAAGLWITGTEIPWAAIRSIARKSRRLKTIGVDTIVVEAQARRRTEPIEIDLSDSVEDPEELYDKLQSAAAAHGAQLHAADRELRMARMPSQESRARLGKNRELLRQALEHAEQRRARLPEEIATTEAQIEAVKSRIAQSETRISELEASLTDGGPFKEQKQKNLELTRTSLQTNLRLRDSLERLLQTQRSAYEKRR
jgi:hypothetical protein